MSPGLLSGKVALVTGAGRGIGAGTARALAREGAAVALSSPLHEELADTVCALAEIGAEHAAFACDVTDRRQVDAYVAAAVSRFGRLDILVNNAAYTGFSLVGVEDTAAEQVRQHVEVDVLGTLNCMQACFPHLRVRGGSVVNFASDAGTSGFRNEAGYAIAKEAVRGLTKVAAAEWGPHGITVNVIAPAARTEALTAFFTRQPPGAEERFTRSVPLRRLGDPETDIGRAVVALASPLAAFVTGRTIFVDGGQGSFR